MALTASSLIQAAKQRSLGTMGRQKISDAMLLEELSFQNQLLTQMVSQIAPDLMATITGSITVTDAGNANGYTLQNGIHYRDFTHVDETDEKYVPITIVQRQHRQSSIKDPAGMVNYGSVAGVFYPIDPLRKQWDSDDARNWFEPDESHTVTYSYVPLPTPLTSLSDTLDVPDFAREVIMESLVLTILSAQIGSLPPAMQEAAQIKIQTAMQKRRGALDAFRLQLYKLVSPQGARPAGGGREQSDTAWVNDQVAS